jgi:dTDP-4-amino-4,6-dideoxygalactose transaminase
MRRWRAERRRSSTSTWRRRSEQDYIREAIGEGWLSGDGLFTKRCQVWLEGQMGCAKALLTHSCTAALEMAALLAGIQPGDEIILPSFTFASTANAFVLRGGVPVFVDVRPDTLNIDETLIEAAITPRTRAIVVVHYAGVGCAMDVILDIGERHGLLVIEDAAHGVLAKFKGRPLGSFGHLAALSFHETKNLISGEGGALLVNDPRLIERAEILREKGTNRAQFFRGEVAKYSWVDIGSSYLPSEILAAFLWAQFEAAAMITERRLTLWSRYHTAFADLERQRRLRRPIVPLECQPNGHMYHLLMPDLEARTRLLASLRREDIQAVFHYVPLHSSTAGQTYGRSHGSLAQTDAASDRLVRLPLWVDMTGEDVDTVIRAVTQSLAP